MLLAVTTEFSRRMMETWIHSRPAQSPGARSKPPNNRSWLHVSKGPTRPHRGFGATGRPVRARRPTLGGNLPHAGAASGTQDGPGPAGSGTLIHADEPRSFFLGPSPRTGGNPHHASKFQGSSHPRHRSGRKQEAGYTRRDLFVWEGRVRGGGALRPASQLQQM